MGHLTDNLLNIFEKSTTKMSFSNIQKQYLAMTKKQNRLNDTLSRTSFERGLKIFEKYNIKIRKEYNRKENKVYYFLEK